MIAGDVASVTLAEMFVVTAGVIVGLFVAVCALALVATRLRDTIVGRAARRLWRNNVTHPVTRWQRQVIQDRIEWLMTHPNGGSSLHDLGRGMRELRSLVEQHISESTEDRAELHRQVDTLLDHDAERDRPGRRYAAEVDPEPEEEPCPESSHGSG